MSAYKQSVGKDTEKVFSKIYLTEFDVAWQAVLEALKAIPLETANRESGVIQTKWTDNTAQRRAFSDTFVGARAYMKAQYRFSVTVAKGFFQGKPSIKVSIQKDQLIERDVLEGWRKVESDSIDENTLLYRIGRLVWVRTRLAQIEKEKTEKEIQSTEF